MRGKIGMVARTREVTNTKRRESGLIGNLTMIKVPIIGDMIGTMGNLIINHGRIRINRTTKQVIHGDRMTQNSKSRMNGDRVHQISGE